MSNNEFHQRRLSATPRGVGVMCNFFAQSAENATLKDVEGNEYIDFAAGIAVLNTGHRHPLRRRASGGRSGRGGGAATATVYPHRVSDCAV